MSSCSRRESGRGIGGCDSSRILRWKPTGSAANHEGLGTTSAVLRPQALWSTNRAHFRPIRRKFTKGHQHREPPQPPPLKRAKPGGIQKTFCTDPEAMPKICAGDCGTIALLPQRDAGVAMKKPRRSGAEPEQAESWSPSGGRALVGGGCAVAQFTGVTLATRPPWR
jgi:hypothetical protein